MKINIMCTSEKKIPFEYNKKMKLCIKFDTLYIKVLSEDFVSWLISKYRGQSD